MAVGAEVQVTDLTAGDHACLTFGEPEDLFDLTAAFVRDGLACGLKVVWISDSAPQRAATELARRGIAVEAALAAGQLTAAECEGGLLSGQEFDARRATDWLTSQMAACQRDGFPGLRVAVDMSWALRPVTGVENLPDFERGVAAALAGTAVSVLCQYDREGFDPVTLATVSAFHTRSVAAATYYADAMLRICRQYAPPGIRLAGEIDYQHAEQLALALTEALRFEGDIAVNMTALTFIDGTCARMIMDAARGLGADRAVALHCHPAIAATFELLGADDMTGVSVVSGHDR
ncbi:MAG TPA: MEDS domain-containing protein [Streptosporangiaceae bacterium]|nr:MEDS domain-containing protein [Streptosporangiaceae bacterium]